ncbi:MAG: type I-B CRISPR-associated protein Cas7/Csh2 [Thermoplasmataceae archaeon]|jgi:CRISPR-associated protein Csh2
MNNGEILYIYDANLTNPNGDPDDENRPRMDYQSRRNLVSDVRLKRYIRDFLQDQGKQLYVENPENGQVIDASTRIKNFLGHPAKAEDIEQIVKELIDVRLFGATIPIKKDKEEGKGDSIKITGPTQFSWGYSLNEVDLVDSYSITSRFSSGEGKKQGTIGKDYRVYYSLIGFYGIISGHRAMHTGMNEDDAALLDKCLIKAIPQQATRSKIGQFPKLYVRIVYKDQETVLGDLRDSITLKNKKNLRNIENVVVSLDLLASKLEMYKHLIEKIYFWQDSNLKTEYKGSPETLESVLLKVGLNCESIKI